MAYTLFILGFFFTLFFSIRLLNEKKDSMLTYLRSIGLLVASLPCAHD